MEIFNFKIKFSKYPKICHFSSWRFWTSGWKIRRNEVEINKKSLLIIFKRARIKVKKFVMREYWKTGLWQMAFRIYKKFWGTNVNGLFRKVYPVDGRRPRFSEYSVSKSNFQNIPRNVVFHLGHFRKDVEIFDEMEP